MAATQIYMDATLEPSRSLSPRGFVILMTVLTLMSLTMGIAFLSIGLFPIFGFFGLDMLVLWTVFQRNFRDQRQRTYVRVTADSLEVRHIDSKGQEVSTSMPSAFARVDLTSPGSPNGFIRLAASGRAYIIGKFLTPQERRSFVDSLKEALQRARAERHLTA